MEAARGVDRSSKTVLKLVGGVRTAVPRLEVERQCAIVWLRGFVRNYFLRWLSSDLSRIETPGPVRTA
ncbi:hypothetical protein PanWU01x14_336350 [Parasponia andersonii]|uniref:Uncharacterized protein n=1 Tax=Parasponia andersonii TaxID=3476 RepID=A0A2P5AFY0_PARAD|nr:hypothetical protein PanWU01x14_336350 [Parasponia andersonii]